MNSILVLVPKLKSKVRLSNQEVDTMEEFTSCLCCV